MSSDAPKLLVIGQCSVHGTIQAVHAAIPSALQSAKIARSADASGLTFGKLPEDVCKC